MDDDEVAAAQQQQDSDGEVDDTPKYTGVFGPSNVLELCVKISNHNHERYVFLSCESW